jgi:hypothetical protein
MTSSVFALSTVYWILSVVFTFIYIDSLNNMATACYGDDDLNASSCLLQKTVTTPASIRAAAWLKMLDDILLVNVSTVQYRVPASYTRIIRRHPVN